MKRIFVGIFAVLALAACQQNGAQHQTENAANETSAVSAASAPVMNFEQKTYDFGKITQGEKVSYDFIFTNTGKTPLIIKDAVASCGCTVPDPPKDPIAPGAKSKINVVFSSAGKMGLQDKVVTVTANTIPAQTQIHLIGEVVK